MLRLLMVTVLLGACSRAAELSGRVTGVEGKPVASARVTVAGVPATTVTAANGLFRLTGLPAGLIRLSVAAQGYFESRDIQVDPAEEPSIEIRLTEAGTLEQSIVVTGTSTPHLLVDAPVRTELVSHELTEALVKRTLGEALTATVPGLRIENNCSNCGFSAIRLNGLEGPYTQILEDGLPTLSGVSTVYGLDQIPTEFLEQLEVVKGGNSALYGPNAVAGVINLVRRQPRENFFQIDGLSGWQRGRPEQQTGAAAQLIALPGGLSGDFYFRSIRKTHIDRDRDGFTELPRRDLRAGGVSLYRKFFDGQATLAFGGSAGSEFRRGGSQLDARPEDTYVTEQIQSLRRAGFARFQHAATPATFYSLNASYSHFVRDSYYGAGFDPNAYGVTRNPLFASDAQIGHQLGRHTLLGGFQYWSERVDDRIPAYDRRFDSRFTNRGLYVQDEYRIRPNLVVVGGARGDRSNIVNGWVWSPRANVRYGIGQNWNLRAGVSTGFRAPAIFDEDLHVAAVGGEGFLIAPAPGLRKERSLSFSGSLDYNAQINGKRIQLGAGFFHTSLRDNFQLREAERDGFRLFERVNGAGSYVRGVEFSGNVQVNRRVGLRGGATFQLARFRQPEPQFGSLRFFRTPNAYGFAAVDLDLPGGLDIITSGDFTGRMVVPHFAGYIESDRLARSQRFAVFNVIASRTWELTDRRSIRLFAAALNLTDDYQRDFDQGPNRDSRYIYGPAQMRQVNLGVTLRF
ncbi:MAG: TonB-dependent receptor [Bryobacteraceae bacterium]|nr:TonB-dependent receptor [Bryobacteraceae bacterium]